ncbi:Bro-N domain-containing protein [Marinovum algicola]|uniref:BRO-N domain-containing protein n=1 Tax=Marinovum algicola TaxID=42444 RepID=UPI003B520F41
MTADIIPFDFEEQAVRVVMRGEDPWFVAADVCRVLGISNARDAVSRLDDDERDQVDAMTVGNTDGQTQRGGARVFNIINESGLYALIFTSSKVEAKRFRKWVTSEVLPALRTYGRYDMPGVPANDPGPEAGDIAGLPIRQAELAIAVLAKDHQPHRCGNASEAGETKNDLASFRCQQVPSPIERPDLRNQETVAHVETPVCPCVFEAVEEQHINEGSKNYDCVKTNQRVVPNSLRYWIAPPPSQFWSKIFGGNTGYHASDGGDEREGNAKKADEIVGITPIMKHLVQCLGGRRTQSISKVGEACRDLRGADQARRTAPLVHEYDLDCRNVANRAEQAGNYQVAVIQAAPPKIDPSLTFPEHARNFSVQPQKTTAGIGTPSVSRRSQAAPPMRGFSYGRAFGTSERGAAPRGGSSNPVRPATRNWNSCGWVNPISRRAA